MLELPGGKRWLIDCGRQAPDQLHDAGVSWHEIHGQIITHVHGDHVFGLEDFALRRYYEGGHGIGPIREGGPRPLLINHSAVEAELWETLGPAVRYIPGDPANPAAGTLETYFERIDPSSVEPPAQNPWRHSETFDAGGLRLVARETDHVPGKPSTCLEIALDPADDDAGTRRIAWWSGDSTVDRDYLESIADRTSIFFHDCSFVDYPGQVHGAYVGLRELPESIRTRMVLMHHEDNIEENRARAEGEGFRIGMPGDVYDLITGQRA